MPHILKKGILTLSPLEVLSGALRKWGLPREALSIAKSEVGWPSTRTRCVILKVKKVLTPPALYALNNASVAGINKHDQIELLNEYFHCNFKRLLPTTS